MLDPCLTKTLESSSNCILFLRTQVLQEPESTTAESRQDRRIVKRNITKPSRFCNEPNDPRGILLIHALITQPHEMELATSVVTSHALRHEGGGNDVVGKQTTHNVFHVDGFAAS